MTVAEAPARCAVERMPEVVAQARSGLMAVHGRDAGHPRRLGLNVASVAASIVAAQATRAVQLARLRGLRVQIVETSVLDAALLFVAHHIAIATSGDPLRPPRAGPGPPFPTADGHWVELEALTPTAWQGLWERLGVSREISAAAWSSFVLRYLAGSCGLPPALHEASKRHDLAQLRAAASQSGVELCRQRGYPELQAEDPVRPPWILAPGPPGGARPLPAATGASPLAGMRVVELATRLQGPLAGHLLRLLGAAVVKLEPPGGDIGRRASSGFGWAAYRAYNHGKRVVELDLKAPGGRAQLEELAADADVFLHNSPPGRAERLGFDAASLARVNPSLVHAHASGWGAAGPTQIAGDFLVQAHAGCADGLTPLGERPTPSRVTILDVMGGLLACDGILAGLLLRERSERAGAVQTSLLAAADVLQRDVRAAIAARREVRRRAGRPLWGPLDEPLQTVDGWLAVAAADAPARRRLAGACEMHAIDDERTARHLAQRPAAESQAMLSAAGVDAAVVCEDVRTLASASATSRSLVRLDDDCCVPAAPWRFDET